MEETVVKCPSCLFLGCGISFSIRLEAPNGDKEGNLSLRIGERAALRCRLGEHCPLQTPRGSTGAAAWLSLQKVSCCAGFQESSGDPRHSASTLGNVFSAIRTFEKYLTSSDEKPRIAWRTKSCISVKSSCRFRGF